MFFNITCRIPDPSYRTDAFLHLHLIVTFLYFDITYSTFIFKKHCLIEINTEPLINPEGILKSA